MLKQTPLFVAYVLIFAGPFGSGTLGQSSPSKMLSLTRANLCFTEGSFPWLAGQARVTRDKSRPTVLNRHVDRFLQ
jgi:hypothetical protein